MSQEKPKAHLEESVHKMRHDTMMMDSMVHIDDTQKLLSDNRKMTRQNIKEAGKGIEPEEDMASFQVGDNNYYGVKQEKSKGKGKGSGLLKTALIAGGMLASGGLGAAIPLAIQALQKTEVIEPVDTNTKYEIGIE